ncbi:MAG: NAD-dependent succinate-semialdehyde dehydrogenase [Hydrogenophaga sp.]|uniref:NAD-dependent succinate-semialdehyde dehydrogenase n=1 Tax=Hydrogenophaga sp. TaxID=1904254 RepID=UPI0025BDAE17|nr:NAD-dependent succinate-semialdehyde dehydrogenase [Hydrogenophaga sp.]MBU7575599.1 NAD-dependent succinate-semialdehyde dehydrogenase [Hydrogenophaga sp.]
MSTVHSYLSSLSLHIAGEWRGISGRDTLPVINPATGAELGRLPMATERDIDDALAAAQAAFPAWSQASAWERDRILQRAAVLIHERRDAIAHSLTLENGKPLADAQGEIDRVIETITWCAEEGKRAYGRVLPPRSHRLTQTTLKRAIGPVAAFVPWNFPMVLAARKVAAALAAGCTVVLKPAEETPASCIELVRAFLDAGLPPGALSLLFGVPAQVSQRLIASPVIRKISFTGSVAVGRLLATQAAQQLKPATMELGGHAPVVVFDDVDVDKVAAACAAFKFRNAGQVCLSPSRFYVHDSIAERFAQRLAAHAQALQVGDGLTPGVQMGPLNNERRLQAAQALVDDARAAGARVLTGGQRIGTQGFFFQPTVLTQLPASARLLKEEPFCPVAPVMSFATLDEVIALANDSDMGLAAYAFTNRLDRAAEFSERVEAGWIGINSFTPALADAPIAGMKDSGLGMEGGPEGLDAYLHSRFVSQSSLAT